MPLKQCTKCGQEKSRDQFGTRLDRDKPRAHPTCKPCRVKAAEESRLKIMYGITLQERDSILLKQGGVCAICRRAPRGKGSNAVLHCDHDHRSGKFRGLLCPNCNKAIGLLDDNAGIFRLVADYLEAHT